jgi:ACS family pantothenate transporter-like MFS transporter
MHLSTHKAPNAQTIYALRFFLGLLSASFWPSVVALIFNWYTPSELAIRLAFFNVSDVAGAMFLGVLQATLYRDMNGVHGLSGWMWLFIIAGAITVGQGLLAFITIPDSPAITRAIWLTKAERQLARDRMDEFGATTSRMVPASVLKLKLRQLVAHPVTYFVMISFALSAWSSRANSYFVRKWKAYSPTSHDEHVADTYSLTHSIPRNNQRQRRKPQIQHLRRQHSATRWLCTTNRHEHCFQLAQRLEALALANQRLLCTCISHRALST